MSCFWLPFNSNKEVNGLKAFRATIYKVIMLLFAKPVLCRYG